MEEDNIEYVGLYFINVLVAKYISIENFEFSQNKNFFTRIFRKVDYNQLIIAYSQLLDLSTKTYEEFKSTTYKNDNLKDILDNCFYYFGLLLMSCCAINNELYKKTVNQSSINFNDYNLLYADRNAKRKLLENNIDILNTYLQQTYKGSDRNI